MTAEIFIRAHIIGKTKPRLKQLFVFSSTLISVISKIRNTNYQDSPNLPYWVDRGNDFISNRYINGRIDLKKVSWINL